LNPDDRSKMDCLGKSFGLLRAAHYSVRAAAGSQRKESMDLAVRQWGLACEAYADAISSLIAVPVAKPGSPEEVLSGVKKTILGRISGGAYHKLDG
jgi:hypothetical protein